MTSPMRLGLKLIIVFVLFGALLWSVDVSSLSQHIGRITWQSVLLIMLALAGQFFVSAWKWSWALRMHELHVRYLHLLRVTCVGSFVNNFLPTSIGGDAYRIMQTLPSTGVRSRALSAVIVERMAGFAILLGFGFTGACTYFQTSGLARTFVLLLVAGALGFGLLVVAAHRKWFTRLTARLRNQRAFAAIEQNMTYIRLSGRRSLAFLALAILYQACAISIVQLIFTAVGEDTSFLQCAFITAALGIASLMPFSINGIGINEASMTGTAVAIGVPYESALLAAVLLRILQLPITLACGLFYLAPTDSKRAVESLANDVLPESH
jgi:glycosyltransferase 2 family protein